MTTKIDLLTAAGNAYALMAIARECARTEGWGEIRINQLMTHLKGTQSYPELLSAIEEELPQRFEFEHDPRESFGRHDLH
jgi:hypothetical protein